MRRNTDSAAGRLVDGLEEASVRLTNKALDESFEPNPNLNIIAPESKETVLQLAAKAKKDGEPQCNVELTRRLIEKGADVNFANKEFETVIAWVARQDSNSVKNQFQIMEMLIQNRKLITADQIRLFVDICERNLTSQDLTLNDFGMLSHFVSRLCGVNIGKLLNDDDRYNADRYLTHLCEYKDAKRYGKRLEGWRSLNFLSIRIFSLFETLVKLQKGWLLPAQQSEQYKTEIIAEILHEVETVKIIQETNAIHSAVELDDSQKNTLLKTVAKKFLTRLQENPKKEFCLASGYNGHAIYIVFHFSEDEKKYIIRFDNLGLGINKPDKTPRHPVDDTGKTKMIYPVWKSCEADAIEALKVYIVDLFKMKKQKFTDDQAKQAKVDILEKIYDDGNVVLKPYVSNPQSGLEREKQTSGTCAATNHQIGLLARHDKDFYEWIVAEEKRCIVQRGRNEGAKDANEDKFWEIEEKEIPNVKNQDALCCPCNIDELLTIAVETLINTLKIQKTAAAELSRIQQIFMPVIRYPSSLHELKKLYNGLSSFKQQPNSLEDKLIIIIKGAITFKLGLNEPSKLRAYMLFDEAKSYFVSLTNKFEDFIDKVIGQKFEVMIAYYKALAQFLMGVTEKVKSDFEACLDSIHTFLLAINEEIGKRQPRGASSAWGSLLHTEYVPPEEQKLKEYRKWLLLMQDNLNIALGYLHYSKSASNSEDVSSIVLAKQHFEQTAKHTQIDEYGIQHLDRKFQCFPSLALLGLALIYYGERNFLSAYNCCNEAKKNKMPNTALLRNASLMRKLSDEYTNEAVESKQKASIDPRKRKSTSGDDDTAIESAAKLQRKDSASKAEMEDDNAQDHDEAQQKSDTAGISSMLFKQ